MAALTAGRRWGGFLAAALATSACAPEPACEEWCGTIVVAAAAEPGTLFPPATRGDVEFSLASLIFERLATVGPEMNTFGDRGFVPELARSWESEDDRTILVHLDPEARWHDGVPVTAHDVVFTFEVFRDPVVNSTQRPRLAHIVSVTARDSLTVVVRYDRPYPEQLYDAVYHTWIIPRHLLDTVPRDRLRSHPFGRQPVGSGPFRFVRWEPAAFVELAADSTYRRGRPGVPRIIWRVTADAPTAVTQLLAEEADVLSQLPRPEDAERVQRAPHLAIHPYPMPVYSYIAFNARDPADLTRPHPLFADRELRRALSMAVDRGAIIQTVLGPNGGVIPAGPVSPVMGIWSDTLPRIPFDTVAARQLLERLGWEDRDGDGTRERRGRRLAFDLLVPSSSIPRVRAAQIVQDQLRRIGVAVAITELEYNTFDQRGHAGRFDAYFGALAQDPSPSSLADTWTTSAIGGLNYPRYSNPAFDQLVAAAQRELDPDRALGLWHQAVAAIVADAPAIWVYAPFPRAAIHRRLQNVTLRRDLWSATMWTWRVDAARMLERDRIGVR